MRYCLDQNGTPCKSFRRSHRGYVGGRGYKSVDSFKLVYEDGDEVWMTKDTFRERCTRINRVQYRNMVRRHAEVA